MLTSFHRKGQKTFRADDIATIQFKEPGLTVGFIQFTFGGMERAGSKGGKAGDAVRDENAVIFKAAALDDFRRVRDAIESARIRPRGHGATGSVTDELTKLAALRDAGVLTHEEFEAQKRRIL